MVARDHTDVDYCSTVVAHYNGSEIDHRQPVVDEDSKKPTCRGGSYINIDINRDKNLPR